MWKQKKIIIMSLQEYSLVSLRYVDKCKKNYADAFSSSFSLKYLYIKKFYHIVYFACSRFFCSKNYIEIINTVNEKCWKWEY